MIRNFVLAMAVLFPLMGRALEIPKQLSQPDRAEVTRTLGFNSTQKLLSNPYPLGGYSGLELGLSLEVIDIKDLNRLGCNPGDTGCTNVERSDEKELSYSRLTVGKGLYNDLDVFVNVALPTEGVDISDFGAQMRWSFYQAQFLPIIMSLLVHGNHMNLNNTFTSESYGAEIITGITVRDFSIYFGGGYIQSTSQLICGSSNNATVNSSEPQCQANTNFIETTQYGTHSLVGISLTFSKFFVATQIDRYRDPVFSAKVGVRL